MTSEARNEGSTQTPGSVWIVLWHDENRGDRNVGVHGVFADETMAREETDRMNRDASYVYTAVNYVVTPNISLDRHQTKPKEGGE